MTACTDPACARLREEIREALIQAWADQLGCGDRPVESARTSGTTEGSTT